MKIIFATCISGNGHITQAISMNQILNEGGYKVSYVLAAKKSGGFDDYFLNNFSVRCHDGFDFVFDKNGGLNIFATVYKNLFKLPLLILSFIKLYKFIKKEKPDLIFNYYEPVVGLTALFFPNIKYISIGHQYAMTSFFYPKVRGYFFQKLFLRIINFITSIRSEKIAMSYYEFPDEKLNIFPPILRKESYTLTTNKQEDFILVYLMNQDLLPDLINECKKYPDLKVECFTKLINKFENLPKNLILNNLCGNTFQQKMKVCKAVICSGGFETTSEAIYQKKPVLMIPIKNHFEQHSNCLDAYVHNFAIYNDTIDLSKIPIYQPGNKEWFDTYREKTKKIFLKYKIFIP